METGTNEKRTPENMISGDESIQEMQLKIMKKQLWYSRLTIVTFLVLILVVGYMVVQVSSLVPQVNSVLDNVEEISADLRDEKLSDTIRDIDEFTKTSQTGVEQAIEKLERIDLDSLNEAIQDLNSLISPLANFFGKK